MKRLLYLAAIALMWSCGNSSTKVSEDEKERPVEWQAEMTLVMDRDTMNDESEQHKIVSYESNGSFQELVDQLWQLAFSGEAEIRGVDMLGEIDEENPLSPEALLEYLKTYDTVYVEDLMTGVISDTVIDNSFTASEVSAINIYQAIQPATDNWSVYAIGLGKNIFAEGTGEYRGVKHKFFLKFADEPDASDAVFQRLLVQSDSNGIFHPTSFIHYTGNTMLPFEDYVNPPESDKTFAVDLSMKLHFIDPELEVVRVTRPPEA